MPNILKRPMFRRGGSVANGAGITSGLERKKYAEGPSIYEVSLMGRDPINPNEEARMLTDIQPGIYDQEMYNRYQAQQNRPTTRPFASSDKARVAMGIQDAIAKKIGAKGNSVDDLLAGIAATTPDDPTKLQTWGSVLGKAGASAMGLRKQREAAVDKFISESGLQMIKNLTDDDRTALFKNIDALMARNPKLTYDQALKLALGQGTQSAYLKTLSPEAQIAKDAKEKYSTYPSVIAKNLATFDYYLYNNKLPQNIINKLDPNKNYIDLGEMRSDLAPKDERTAKKFTPGKIYFNPSDNQFYNYDGTKFKPVSS